MEGPLCPKCGANVEGLVEWCDCCGAALDPKKTLFSWMTYSTGAFFDIGLYLGEIFEKLDQIPPEPYADYLERIEFDFWCYPIDKRSGVTYYASRKHAIVTIEVDPEEYLWGTKEEKRALLLREVKEKLRLLQGRLEKKDIHIDDLFQRVDGILR